MRYDHISVVVMGDNSCLSGRGFESRRRILDGYYSHCFVVKIVLFYWKDQKQTKKSLGLERRWKLKSTEVTESSGRPDHRSLTVDGLHLYCITLAQNEKILLFLKMRHPRSLFHFFGLFQTNINTILQQIKWKNVHPVFGTGIRTHNFQNVSLLP